jgi:hypothetical protein
VALLLACDNLSERTNHVRTFVIPPCAQGYGHRTDGMRADRLRKIRRYA